LSASVDDPREGILGPRSIGWELGGDVGLFVGGGRATLLQLAHPFVAHAIDQHSKTRSDVAGRFQRTFRNVFAMLYGDLDDACRAARRVHAIHTRVHGTMTDAIGAWPAGSPYHANDLDALVWVHSTLVDTTLVMREVLDGPLDESRKDAYLDELRRFGALFGIPRARLPGSWRAHRDYMSAMLASGQIAVAPCAREMAQFLFGRGDAARSQPALGRLAEAVTHVLLPPDLATQFGLRGAPRSTRVVLATFAQIYRRLPRAMLEFPACSEARNRLLGRGPSRWSAWTERQLFGLAQRTTGG
jgi:uncharacterized protein (DUF2236 family)